MPPIPNLKYFRPEEFNAFGLMDPEFLQWLDEVRSRVGSAFFLTSDARTPQHNAEVGGVPTSLHIADARRSILAAASDFVTVAIKGGDRTDRVREFMRLVMAAVDARDELALQRGVQVEIVYSAKDKHYHLGLFRDARPDELIFALD